MKTLFKILALLLGVLLLLGAVTLGLGTLRHADGPEAPGHAVVLSSDSLVLAEGRRLVRAYACAECHGDDLAGTDFIEGMPFMNLPASNLTGGAFTAEQLEAALRHGRGADGRALVIMPSRAFAHLSDDDIAAMISYLLTLPPVEKTLVERSVGPIGRLAATMDPDGLFEHRGIDHSAPHIPTRPSEDLGAYLANFCAFCHARDFGGQVLAAPVEHWVPNLTKSASGIGAWTLEDFQHAVQGGVRPEGPDLDPGLMPWKAFTALTPEEIEALWTHLRSLPAVDRTDPTADEGA